MTRLTPNSGGMDQKTEHEASLHDETGEREFYIDELTPELIEKLDKEIGVPFENFRGHGGFYDEVELQHESTCVNTCAGTSCHLCGATQERRNMRRFGHSCETAWCLGHCDRSPVSLDEFTLEHVDISSEIRCLASRPVVTARILDHSIEKLGPAKAAGVYTSLPLAFSRTPKELVEELIAAVVKGRTRPGEPVGERWKTVAAEKSSDKYVVVNGAEGNPGSFVDRVLMEEDPHTIIEAMVLCGFAVGAQQGIGPQPSRRCCALTLGLAKANSNQSPFLPLDPNHPAGAAP